jgi:hypothetical protein
MGTGAGLLERARKHIGEDYVNTRVPKDDPNWHGPWDCAEFMSWLVFQEAGILYGCTNNNAPPAQADAYTGAWQTDSKTRGIRISVDDAAGTAGAILLRYPPAPGKMGHIVISDGKGGTVEAMGKAFGVRAGTVQGRHWDTGVLIPGIDYGTGDTAIHVASPVYRYAPNVENMNKSTVVEIQRALAAKGLDPGAINGVFGEATAIAVAAFQDSLGLVTDGEVGRETANALGILLPGMKPELLGNLLGEVGMNPLIAIAASILPEIIKTIAGDKAGAVSAEISKAVTQVTKSTDPQEIKEKLKQDPAALTELQVKLAEIAAAQEEKRQAAQLALLQEQYKDEEKKRALQLEKMKASIEDTKGARGNLLAFAQSNSLLAWAPLAISVVILFGFFYILNNLITGGIPKPAADREQSLQLIYIVVGAVTAAFTTVVGFWLGSSQGSRSKDESSFVFQAQQADVIKTQSEGKDIALKAATKSADSKAELGKDTQSKFQKCFEIVLAREGGFSNHPEDKGGPTNLGITMSVLKEWRNKDKDENEDVTIDDVRNLTRDEAREIYRTRYWNLLQCDELPKGVDLVVFDFGVNAGPSRSAKMLQKIIGADGDGSIGPVTIGACKLTPARDIITKMSDMRLEYYKERPNAATFLNGWTNRTEVVKRAALEMLDA